MSAEDLEGAVAEVAQPTRIATPSIRGYYYQFLWTIKCWLELGADHSLLTEGNEDIDVAIGNGVEHHSIKHLAGSATESTKLVEITIGNFAVEYVYQRRRGKQARFVLRTTARLVRPKVETALTPWLHGEVVEAVDVRNRILQCAVDRRALVAIRYLSRVGLLDEFLASIRWSWGERDYQGLREDLVQQVLEDARFAGLSPVDVADKLIARVVQVSSSQAGDLGARRLTAFDLDVIANDLMLNRLVQNFRAAGNQDNLRTLQMAGWSDGANAALVVGRFAASSEVEQALNDFRESSQGRPGAIAWRDPFRSPLSERIFPVLGSVDADFYCSLSSSAVPGQPPAVNALPKLIKVATGRFSVSVAFVADSMISTSVRQVCGDVGVAVRDVDSSDASYRLTLLLARLLVEHQTTEQPTEWQRLSPWIYQKVRYLVKEETGEIFTQKHPFD